MLRRQNKGLLDALDVLVFLEFLELLELLDVLDYLGLSVIIKKSRALTFYG